MTAESSVGQSCPRPWWRMRHRQHSGPCLAHSKLVNSEDPFDDRDGHLLLSNGVTCVESCAKSFHTLLYSALFPILQNKECHLCPIERKGDWLGAWNPFGACGTCAVGTFELVPPWGGGPCLCLCYLLGCTRSQLRHKRASVFTVARGVFSRGTWARSCGTWGPAPWPGIEPRPPALGA